MVIRGFNHCNSAPWTRRRSSQLLSISFLRSGGGRGREDGKRGPLVLDWLGPDAICHRYKSMSTNHLHYLISLFPSNPFLASYLPNCPTIISVSVPVVW